MIEDIIPYLKCPSEEDTELSEFSEFFLSRLCHDASYHHRCRDETSCFFIMEREKTLERKMLLRDERISYLSSHDSEIAECTRDFSHDFTFSCVREELESYGLECITDEYRHRLSILFPDGGLSSTEGIIIHRRKVIMNERIRMEEFYTEKCVYEGIGSISFRDIFVREACENRAKPFP